jgi:hypothetical protein
MEKTYGLPPEILTPVQMYEPKHLTFVDTIARKTGLEESQTFLVQSGLVLGLAATRIWLSGQDQVQGFRRLAFAGLSPKVAMAYGITDSGGFVMSLAKVPEDMAEKGETLDKRPIGELLADFIEDAPYWSVRNAVVGTNFNLNHFGSGSQYLRSELHHRRISSARKYMTGVDVGNNEQKLFFAMLSKTLMARAGRNGGGIRKAMLEAMDPDVLKLARGTRMTDGASLLWLSAARDAHTLSEATADFKSNKPKYRQQALRSYPGLTAPLTSSDVTSKIDAGKSVTEALSVAMKISPTKLKILRGYGYRALGQPADLRDMRLLDDLSPEMLPKSGKGWSALWETYRSLQDDFADMPYRLSNSSMTLQDMQDQVKARHILNIRTNIRDIEQFGSKYPDIAGHHARDMLMSVTDCLLIPAISLSTKDKRVDNDLQSIRSSLFRRLSARIYISSSLKDIEAMSGRWHRNFVPIHAKLDKHVDGLKKHHWESLIGNMEFDVLHIKELTCDRDLEYRGMQEHHCVGGYGSHIRSASTGTPFSLIFAIDRDDSRVSTLEVRVDRNEDGLYEAHAGQNMASRNSTPEDCAFAAADAIVERINAMDPSVISNYCSSMSNTCEQRRKIAPNSSTIEMTCDIQFKRDGYLEEAWELMSQFLPRKMRKEGLDKFVTFALEEYDYLTKNDFRLIATVGEKKVRDPFGADPASADADDFELDAPF